MKKLMALTTMVLLLFSFTTSLACTGIVVGKNATDDGSFIIGRTEDISSAYHKNFLVNPGVVGEGTKTFTDPYNGFTIELPATSFKWTMVSDVVEHDDGQYPQACMNEFGVAISATVSTAVNDFVKEHDPLLKEGGLREAYLPTVVIPYVKTAKEAVEHLGNIIETIGSAEGNTVFIADNEEAWVMEIVSGHQWAAVKVPDDAYAVIPNCMMLGYIDLEDTENVLSSKGIYDFPKEKGFLKTYNDKPHIALTYGSELSDGNRLRAWGGQHYFSPSKAIDYNSEVFEVFQTADEPISLQSAMKALAYRYEGTEYDVNENPQFRAIGAEGTTEAHLYHYKANGVMTQWLSLGNPEHSIYLPSYYHIEDTPEAFKLPGKNYQSQSAYWTFRGLAALCEVDRVQYGQGVKDYWNQYQGELITQMAIEDEVYLSLQEEEKGPYATKLFEEISAKALADATTMTDELMYFLCKRGSMSKTPKAPFSPSLLPKVE